MPAVPTPTIQSFFDPATFTVSHVVSDPVTSRAAIIDSVLDYDPKSGRTSHASADRLIDYLTQQGLQLDWLLETHAHADHLSASAYLKGKLGAAIAIGRPICAVQAVFKNIFNTSDQDTSGADFDQLFDDGDGFMIGELEVRVMQTPGHTPACLTFVIGADAFIGDTLFMPDYGSARCDFPGGDAATLYRSIRRILALPASTRLHLCHDYPPAGREPAWVTSVAEQREKNIHVHDGIDEAAFVRMREARDQTLAMPLLILPAVQVNIRAGKLPAPEDNGVSYLRIPINLL
jgi:glyoxylase-like metal-dependent hydrolase (beta-lactamase superfamily II)